MNEEQKQQYRELGAYAINTMLLAHYGRAIMHLLSEVDGLQLDNADLRQRAGKMELDRNKARRERDDLRRRVGDLEELLRREEARG